MKAGDQLIVVATEVEGEEEEDDAAAAILSFVLNFCKLR